MFVTRIIAVETDEQIRETAALASQIWRQHFTPIIGKNQVEYMLTKFQSYSAIKAQIEQDGYEYFQCLANGVLAGYAGIHEKDHALFLSKLYIYEQFRGYHLATEALKFLVALCKTRGLNCIWLTCNKHNDTTLAIYDHLGFRIVDEQVADIGNGFVMDDYILMYEI